MSVNLHTSNRCEICNKPKSAGDHRKCSRQLQKMHANKNAARAKTDAEIKRQQRDLEVYRQMNRMAKI